MKNGKKHTLVLEFDDEPSAFEDTAFLLFHTPVPNYAFVDDLNHLYNLSLSRTDDIELMGDPWPMFTFRDPLRQLTYYLIERPATSTLGVKHWGPLGKLLLVKGLNANESASDIHDDFTAANNTDPQSPKSELHSNILEYYQQSLTAVTLYDPQLQQPPSKKVAKERAELETLLAAIVDNLDLSGISS